MECQEFQHSFFDEEIKSTLNAFLRNQRLALKKYKPFYHPDYLTGFDFLFPDNFDSQDLLDKLETTGWKPIMVDGYLTGLNYFQHLNKREIPLNIHIRDKKQIDFALFPDMVHDIMGHCPMLFSGSYTNFVREVSDFICSLRIEKRDSEFLALHRSSLTEREKHIDEIEAAENDLKQNPTPYYYHTSMALWTVEFGLIKELDRTSVYGAALVASPREMDTIAGDRMSLVPLTQSSASSQVNVSDLQNCLYYTSSFDEVRDGIFTFPNSVTSV